MGIQHGGGVPDVRQIALIHKLGYKGRRYRIMSTKLRATLYVRRYEHPLFYADIADKRDKAVPI